MKLLKLFPLIALLMMATMSASAEEYSNDSSYEVTDTYLASDDSEDSSSEDTDTSGDSGSSSDDYEE